MYINKLFDIIEPIKIDHPVEKIIQQIKALIDSGQLKPGDRLPAERQLAENFGVGRSYIREAILKLEFYGVLKTNPQSGTFVVGGSIKIMDSIFAEIIKFNEQDFAAFMEARYYLEVDSARLAAKRRTEQDIERLKEAATVFEKSIQQGDFDLKEDLDFHLRLAAAANNSILEALLHILIPHLIKIKPILDKDLAHELNLTLLQHRQILEAVIAQDVEAAGEAMKAHLTPMMNIRLN